MWSLRVKLTLALLVTGLSGIIILTILVQRFTTTEFDNFVVEQEQANFVADMTAYYETYGSWDDMQIVRGRLPFLSPNASRASPPEPPPDRVRFLLTDAEGQVIIPSMGYAPGQVVPEAALQDADRIEVDGETVGYVVAEGLGPDRSGLQEAYLDRINQFLLAAMGGAVLLALVLSLLFARTLTRPLREITAAIQSISRGNLEQQVPVRSQDEIGQVATAFNQMSAHLSRANTLRRQMTADIAHELRTPLSVVVGYLASLSEGLLKPSPERFKVMHDEAQHLQRLVEDLRILSLADAGELPLNLRPVTPAEIINVAAAAFSHEAEQRHITLSAQVEPALPLVHADPDRMLQVLGNLISNAIRHTPEDGRITLVAERQAEHVRLSVQDTGPGIEPEHLPHVFERFYRVDTSRHQEQHESGLGLAIARSIVEAHGGAISAQSTVGEGTTLSIVLPRNLS